MWIRVGRRYYKGQKETFRGDDYIYFLECGDAFPGVYMCHIYLIIQFKHMQFILHHLYYNKCQEI